MAEDYQRAQAEAAALQQALAARRASVIPAPHKVALPMPVSVPGHNNRTTRQMKTALGPDPMHKTQVRAQHYMARAHPLLPRAHSQPVPVRSAQQPLQPVQHVRHVSPASLPALPMPMPIRGPTPVYERVHGLSQLEAQTYDNVKGHTVSTGTGTGTSSISAAASAHNAAPAPAPYRQPTMQDLPLIKPQPRPPGSFEIQTNHHKEDSQYTLSRGALRDERYRERLAAERANANRLQELARSTEAANPAQRSPDSRMNGPRHPHAEYGTPDRPVVIDRRGNHSAPREAMPPAPGPPVKAPGGLMISLDSPLLSPRTRARIITATTGMSIYAPPRVREAESEPVRPVDRPASASSTLSIPRMPPHAQVDIDEYTRFRAQQHGKRPSHPVSPQLQNPNQVARYSPDQVASRRRISLSDDLAGLQHRGPPPHPAWDQTQRDNSIGPVRTIRDFAPQPRGRRLAPYAPRASPGASPAQLPMQARQQQAEANHMSNAAIIATAAAAAIRTHGVRSPAAASFARAAPPPPPQARPISRGADPAQEAAALKDQPGYGEWRREQDAALAAAKEAYEAELENERHSQKVEERKRERLRYVASLKRLQQVEDVHQAGYDDAAKAVERYRAERWHHDNQQDAQVAGGKHGNRSIDGRQHVPVVEQRPVVPAGRPRTSEEEKRRRRKIQYQVFVHARATQCKWKDCRASLTSWSNLEKHIKHAHLKSWGIKEEEVDRRPDIAQLEASGTIQIGSSAVHYCDWANCTKKYDNLDRLYRHCLVEHMGDFCARCPFQCRFEGPDFPSLMAHIERRHPHCTPADFTPAVPRVSPPGSLDEPAPLPYFAPIGAEEKDDREMANDGVTPIVRPASPEPDSRVEKLVQKGCISRLPPDAYDVDNSRDKGWLDRRVAGLVIAAIGKSGRGQAVGYTAVNASTEVNVASQRRGSTDSDKPAIVIEDEDNTSEASTAVITPESLKTLAKDIRKRVRAEMSATPPVFARGTSPWASPRTVPGCVSPAITPRPSKRALLDVSEIELGPHAKRPADEAHRYISPDNERIPARVTRINLRLGCADRSIPQPMATPPSRHLTLPTAGRAPSASPTLSESRLSAPRTPRRPSEVESFKALFAHVNVAPQLMDDATPSPEPALRSADLRDRATSQPSHVVPRRGLLELPAPAIPRPRSLSSQPTARPVFSAHGQRSRTAEDSPLLARAAKILSGEAPLPAQRESHRTAQPALGSLWKSLQHDKHEPVQRLQSMRPEEHYAAESKRDLRNRDVKITYAESEGGETVVESEYEEEEGMTSVRVAA